MKRFALTALLVVLMSTAFVPTASAAVDPSVVFEGLGAARALDLSIPALNILPTLAEQFKGLTVGLTSTAFNGLKNAKSTGLAIGDCGLLPAGLALPGVGGLPVLGSLPCSSATTVSSASDGDQGSDAKKCVDFSLLGLVSIRSSCAASKSVVADGRPASSNVAGVLDTIDIGLNLDLLNTLGLPLGGLPLNLSQPGAVTDQVLGLVNGLVGTVQGVLSSVNIPLVPVQLDQLTGAIVKLLNDIIKNLGRIASIQAGTSTTDVTNQGVISTVTTTAAGIKLGLLGIVDPLIDGLLRIEVSAAKAIASTNDATGQAEASAIPALAVVKVKDLLGLTNSPDGYITANLELPAINNVLSLLNGTPLATTLEVATATPKQVGRSVSAVATGLGIHALKGLGASTLFGTDGGINLKLATANVSAAVDLVKAEVVPAPLPITGGPTYVFLAGAAVLAAAAGYSFRHARRMRTRV